MADEKDKKVTAAAEEEDADKEEADDSEEEKADADDGESDDESAEDKSKADKKKEEHVDWKKVAEDETAARKKAELALAGDRFHSKKKKKDKEADDEDEDDSEDDDDDDEDEENKYLTPRQLEKILARERQSVRSEVLATQIEEIANELAESEDEASAIMAIHANRIFPESLSLKQQLQEAYYIAHGPRLLGKRDELRRALRSKETKGKSGNENTHRDEPKAGEPKLAPQDKEEFKRLGFTWDGKLYTKKLGNGKLLVRDPKTKKTYVQG